MVIIKNTKYLCIPNYQKVVIRDEQLDNEQTDYCQTQYIFIIVSLQSDTHGIGLADSIGKKTKI